MKHQHLKTIEEIKRDHQPVRNVNAEHKQNLSRLDKLALVITEKVGSMGFFMIIFTWTALWLGWNSLAPDHLKFDPFPAFVLWLFISNMIQIFLMPLIMVGQNLQSGHAELRAEADFEINRKAETEIETILMHLENQNALILQILDQIKKTENNKESRA
ncbi:DUF1003 domain-containing protein [Emticicia sp. CRIBPO]|uniref:DUF1003 domain-containing protein n=1 Tax=Emticicia sp. CRIBPO TaxID=2683258 RepID=UPI0014121093|nr:DUF1003 domain-containing protein [Emticicia sp. CRIBPO]NBA86799.1 DUF1003 domain-containing protein [Emticicia sp. CRIBPO]